MNRHALFAAMVTSTAAAASVPAIPVESPILQTMGIIFLGAFGGALFSLMNKDSLSNRAAINFVGRRWLFSQVFSWPAFGVFQMYVDTRSIQVPYEMILLCVAFIVACPRDTIDYISPLKDFVLSVFRKEK